jgi:cellulose synthase/poly-beta-1,6-N-acetylglucosamine synthase-like glycosyltransferase
MSQKLIKNTVVVQKKVTLMLIALFSSSLFVFFGTYLLIYIVYVNYYAKKPWNLKTDASFQPPISILVPAHNEEDVIEKKLENTLAVSYPKQNIEIIVVDDSSDDKTLIKAENFIAQHPEANIKVVKQNPRAGKANALNTALPFSSNSIIIVSDADTYWPSDILEKALPYLADPGIGAITGQGINENTNETWVTRAEDTYLNMTHQIRIGESKMHSTIRFEGGFCAFKKGTFEEFDRETGSDDSGTALDVVQHNHRAILVPEAIFRTSFPTSLPGKVKIKTRRATQLISLWVKCFRLMLKGKLVLPKRIAIPEIMLFIINPLVIFVLLITIILLILTSPFSVFSTAILLFTGALLLFARRMFLEILLDNLILFYALIGFLFGRRYVAWQKTQI